MKNWSKVMIRGLVIILGLFFASNSAFAKGSVPVFFGWGGETLYKVVDLPDTTEFKLNDDYVDIGVKYKGITLFFLPIWQYEVSYIGFIPDSENYYEFTEQEILGMAEIAGISILPVSDVKLGFWTAWGGKLVFLILVGLFFAFVIKAAKEEEEEEV